MMVYSVVMVMMTMMMVMMMIIDGFGWRLSCKVVIYEKFSVFHFNSKHNKSMRESGKEIALVYLWWDLEPDRIVNTV